MKMENIEYGEPREYGEACDNCCRDEKEIAKILANASIVNCNEPSDEEITDYVKNKSLHELDDILCTSDDLPNCEEECQSDNLLFKGDIVSGSDALDSCYEIDEPTNPTVQSSVRIEKLCKFTFGKNGIGITDELVTVGEYIKKLSENNNVYMSQVKCDPIEDNYVMTFSVYDHE